MSDEKKCACPACAVAQSMGYAVCDTHRLTPFRLKIARLEAENKRLREEIQKLRGES